MFSRSSIYELICISVLGFGQMCMMTGYNTQSFVVESVLHSFHTRHPGTIDSYAGYYGQAVMYLVYTFSNLIAPSLLHLFGPKWTIVVGSSMMTLYNFGFLYLNSYLFYAASALMGLGFAMFYAGQGIYVTSHSSMRTISRNSVLVWTINSGCLLVGGGILALIFFFGSDVSLDVQFNNGTEHNKETHFYRQFKDHEVTIMFSVFAGIGLLSNIVFSLLPKREVEDSLSSQKDLKWEGLGKHLGEQLSTCFEWKILLLAPLFMHWGAFTSFWTGVYPTTLVFTKSLSGNLYLLALYSVSVGAGEIVVGLLVTSLSRRYPSFGLRPTMILAVSLSIVTFSLVAASTPPRSSIAPNDEPAAIFQPNMLSVLSIAFLLGSVDASLSSVRSVICALVIPHRRAHVFSSAKFYQSLSGCLIFFLSPRLEVYHCLLVMTSSLLLASVCFWLASKDTKISQIELNEPKKLAESSENEITVKMEESEETTDEGSQGSTIDSTSSEQRRETNTT